MQHASKIKAVCIVRLGRAAVKPGGRLSLRQRPRNIGEQHNLVWENLSRLEQTKDAVRDAVREQRERLRVRRYERLDK